MENDDFLNEFKDMIDWYNLSTQAAGKYVVRVIFER